MNFQIATFNMETKSTRVGLINFVKLLEIESEVDGVENITQSNRVIIPINFSAADKSDKTTPLVQSDNVYQHYLTEKSINFVAVCS